MAGVTRTDLMLAVGFVTAAAAAALLVPRGTPGLQVFNLCGAPVLGVLAVRRTRPVLTVGAIGVFALLGMSASALLWTHEATDDGGGGVWLIALMLGCYSLGVHARGRKVLLGGVLALLVVLMADLPSSSGWALVNGVVFVTTFVGVLPTVVGRTVRERSDRLALLERQRQEIQNEQQARREAAVLTERLRATEKLVPVLVQGLTELSRRAAAESEAGSDAGSDAGRIERMARDLLSRTRQEVVALTQPVELLAMQEPDPVDDLGALRAAAQPWAVLGAGVTGVALALESTGTLDPRAPDWAAVVAGVAVAAPLALLWWRPLTAIVATWAGAVTYSRLVAPLDGTLSGATLALCAAFGVAALSSRGTAVAGLVVCWVGQDLGLPTEDPVGTSVMLLVAWLGGLAVNEVGRLVEQTRANNLVLTGQEAVAAERAVVEERLRLARDLHDQVGHTLTVVALQAGAARRFQADDPARSRSLLHTIASVAEEGVDALSRSNASTDLAALLQRTRAAGLVVDADIEQAGDLDAAARTVVYRIVQEALTNALRHAPGARVRVRVQRTPADLEVVVSNTAPRGRGAGPGTGRGLAGIRERVVAHAGGVSWGPQADGGFAVRATLPLAPLEVTAS